MLIGGQMSRAIKFRLRIGDKIVGYEKWTLTGWVYKPVNQDVWMCNYIHHTDKDQFTGRFAKNEEVYEKDIIKYAISQTQHYKGVVRWSQKSYGFVIDCFWHRQDKIGKPGGVLYEGNFHGTCRLDAVVDLEIIGNVFQNKELLKEPSPDSELDDEIIP